MELKDLLCSLEERLVEHDNNRKEVQNKLHEIYSTMIEEANSFEENMSEELQCSFDSKERRILDLIERINSEKDGANKKEISIKQIKDELVDGLKYEIHFIENADNFVNSYELKAAKVKIDFNIKDKSDNKVFINYLQEHLNNIRESKNTTQDELVKICTERRNEAEELSKKVNEKLEAVFSQEHSRIQETVDLIKDKINDVIIDSGLKTKAKLTLLKNQKYFINKSDGLIIIKEASLKWINFEERKPTGIVVSFNNKEKFSLSFSFFSDEETKVLKTVDSHFKLEMKVWEKSGSEEDSITVKRDLIIGEQTIRFIRSFKDSTVYCMKIRLEYLELYAKWSDCIGFISPPEFSTCVWKECPDNVDEKRKYYVDKDNPRIVTKIDGELHIETICTVIGNTFIPLNKVVSWNIKILESLCSGGINIGVAPFDINQNEYYNCIECGWYFSCYGSSLISGPPHNYTDKEYGPRKGWFGGYVHTGNSVGVVIDMIRVELSFALNGVNLGIAYEGIPLDKPLVPCVFLGTKGDSVELDAIKVKENEVDTSVPVPHGIKQKNISCDSITLVWDAVEGAEFYQIEVNKNKSFLYKSKINTFTMTGLLPDTEHSFRVRTVKNDSLSEWSDDVKGKELDFSRCVWKECPDYVDEKRKYSVDENNPRIATKTGDRVYDCIIIGNAPIPLSKITSWNIKILETERSYKFGIYI